MSTQRTPEELAAWLRLAAEPGLGRATVRHLLAELGLPHQILSASAGTLTRLLPPELAQRLSAPPIDAVHTVMQQAETLLAQTGHHLITLADPDYPASLLDSPDPPFLLFVRGDLSRLHRPSVAIVGARSATEGGKDNARAFARYLAERGWTIISGLARGIDAAAHEGAMQAGADGGGTIAVLAGGLDVMYPPQHTRLAEEIAATGTLVTEYLPGTPPMAYRFPDRNRLVAALSRGVLVVEAATQSGSLLTARLALECSREVFAIPGSIHAPLSRGCHALIRQGAKLVEQGNDIEEELQRTGPLPANNPVAPYPARAPGHPAAARSHGRTDRSPISSSADLLARRAGADTHSEHRAPQPVRPANRMLKDPIINRVLDAMGHDPASTDQICRRSGLDVARVSALLTELELNDVIQRLDDGRFARRQHGIIYG